MYVYHIVSKGKQNFLLKEEKTSKALLLLNKI